MGVRVDYRNAVEVDDLDTIYLTGGGYVRYPFKGISRDSAMGWEEAVWGGNLNRSTGDFALSNIDDVDFGKVARCEISFKYMNVQDYIALCRIATNERHIVADFYRKDIGERVTQEMAFTTNELGKLYAFGTQDLGRTDVSIKLVATNRDKVGLINLEVAITYNANGGSGTIASDSAKWSENRTLADGTGFTRSGYVLVGFNTKADGSGWAYLPNQSVTMFEDLTLYAQWQAAQ